MNVETGEQDTKYVKKSGRKAPKKADHAHDYVRVVTWMRVRRFDGSVSETPAKFSLPPKCVDCGATKRWAGNLDCTEIEVSPREYQVLKEESV